MGDVMKRQKTGVKTCQPRAFFWIDPTILRLTNSTNPGSEDIWATARKRTFKGMNTLNSRTVFLVMMIGILLLAKAGEVTLTWKSLKNAPSALHEMASREIDGELWVVGGFSGHVD